MSMGQLLFNKPCGIDSLESTMKTAKQKFPQLQIIFVIINRHQGAYGKKTFRLNHYILSPLITYRHLRAFRIDIVKRVGDLDLKITTQCVQQKNVTGRNGPDPSIMANICLKLNAKLGGINNLISRDFR
jgi:eukaryotic translation initiation factor 2C